jgi:tRNA (guanosine-2'-O-)-methyltransferase
MHATVTPQRREKIEAVLRQRQKDLTLVLANIHDPHNVSAIYRSCDAFGVSAVHLYYTDTPFPVLSGKTSASARKWVDTVRHASPLALRAALTDHQLLLASCSPVATPVYARDLTRPTAIIMGNEHKGPPADLRAVSDGEIFIPMYGMIQSFNVSVAAALLLAEASRQRREAGMYARASLCPREYEDMLAAWMKK